MVPAVPTSTSFFPGRILSSLPLPALPQISMAGLSVRSSTILLAPVVYSLDASAPTQAARGSSAAGPLSTVVLVSADFGGGPSSGVCVAVFGQSSTFLLSASSTLSGLFAVVISGRSLPSATSDASALDTGTNYRQLAVARLQRDASRQRLASVRPELHRVIDENDERHLALALSHGPFYESHLSLYVLLSRFDAITSQLPPVLDMSYRSSQFLCVVLSSYSWLRCSFLLYL